MNRLMKYVFTKREKFLLVVLVVLALGAVWYCGIYAPLEARIRAADTTDLEDEISLEQIKPERRGLPHLAPSRRTGRHA